MILGACSNENVILLEELPGCLSNVSASTPVAVQASEICHLPDMTQALFIQQRMLLIESDPHILVKPMKTPHVFLCLFCLTPCHDHPNK